MRLPRPPASLADILRWAREMYDYCSEREDVLSPNTLLSRTTRGTSRSANPAISPSESEGGAIQWKGQWTAGTSYETDDIVIRKTLDELDNGYQAGTYIATASISASDVPPGEEPTTAFAVATVSETNQITGFDTAGFIGGYGYQVAPDVTVVAGEGGGEGATAHAVISQGGVVDIVVDDPGSGYWSAEFHFSAPTGTQKWDEFALGRWRKLTLAKVNQKIILNSGRETDTTPFIGIYTNVDNLEVGSVVIDLADIPVAAGNKVLKLREWSVCVDGVTQKAVFLSSEAYDA